MTSDKVRLSVSLTVSEPGEISISDPDAAESLKLVATVRQESSPFPDRAVTILTLYSFLATALADAPDAFIQRDLSSPTDVNDDTIRIHMRPFRVRVSRPVVIGGVRDMHQRSTHTFITVPPPGEGSVKVAWSLAPSRLFYHYDKDIDLQERLKQFTPGQRFRIRRHGSGPWWWTWGSLQHDLRDKKFSRWSLPNDMPLVREEGQDEGDEINCSLVDHVDRTKVASVIRWWNMEGTPPPEDEEPPKVKEMRADGWVFGEPLHGIEMTSNEEVTFDFVE